MKRIYLSTAVRIERAYPAPMVLNSALKVALQDLAAAANGYDLHDLRWQVVPCGDEVTLGATAWIEVQVDERGEAI